MRVDAARALLERLERDVSNWDLDDDDDGSTRDLLAEVRAYLAAHPAQEQP